MSNEENQNNNENQNTEEIKENNQEVEQTETNEKQTNEKKGICTCNKNFWLGFGICFAIFLGIFLAAYLCIGSIMKHNMNKYQFPERNEFIKMHDDFDVFDDFNDIEKNIKKKMEKDLFKMNKEMIKAEKSSPIKIKETENGYKVVINLKNFDGNKENVNIKYLDNGIKISGKMDRNNRNEKIKSEFIQNIIFPRDIDNDKIKQEIKDNKIIINIPYDND